MKKQSKVVRLVDNLHECIVGSVCYWKLFIRSGIVYGFVPASVALLDYLASDDSGTNGKVNSLKHSKLLSFIWSMLLCLNLAGFVQLRNGQAGSVQLFAWTAAATLFGLYNLFVVTAILLQQQNAEEMSDKKLYAHTLDFIVRNPSKSLFVLLLTVSAIGIGGVNLVLYFFLVPSFYWLILLKAMNRQQEKAGIETKTPEMSH